MIYTTDVCLNFPDQPTAQASLITAFGQDANGNLVYDPTQVMLDFIGPLQKPTGATVNFTDDNGNVIGTAPVMTTDGRYNVNLRSNEALPATLTQYVITPVIPKRIWAPDFTALPANPPAPVYETDTDGNLILDENGNPIPVTAGYVGNTTAGPYPAALPEGP